MGEEGLGLEQVGGEDGARETLGHVVVDVDRLVEVLILEEVEHRREGLIAYNVGLSGHLDDRGLNIEGALFGDLVAAAEHGAALGLGLLDGRHHVVDRAFVDHRAHEGAVLDRITDAHLFVGVDQGLGELAGDRLVHDDASRAGAALARGADGAEEDRRDGYFEVGVFGHDDGVVTAQLEDRAAETAGHHLGDAAPHLGGAGEGDQRQARVVDQPLAHGASRAGDEAEDAFQAVVGHDLVADVLGGHAGQRRGGGGLPHSGVAADRRDGGVPRPDCHGEVERRDHADGTERMPLFVHAVAGTLGVDREPIELARETDREVADIDHLLHLAVSLGADFAHLEGDQVA